MTELNHRPLESVELYSDLCNIVERNYQGMPRPRTAGDDGTFHTSTAARAAANDIIDVVYRALDSAVMFSTLEELVGVMAPGLTEESRKSLADSLRESGISVDDIRDGILSAIRGR